MQFGISTSIANASLARSQGWDYIEESAQALLQPFIDDEGWTLPLSPLPILACNLLVPASVKLVGTAVDREVQDRYMTRAINRAARLGVRTVVLGSAGARMVPDGFDPSVARSQLIDFLKRVAPVAGKHGVTIALEPLHRGECNCINTLGEARSILSDAGNPPGLRLTFDSYHFWQENESALNLEDAALVAHVHVADPGTRGAPKGGFERQYHVLFRTLKRVGYDACISVESPAFDAAAIKRDGAAVLAFLREEWTRA